MIPVGGFTEENCAAMDRLFENTFAVAWCHRCGRVWMKRMFGRPITCPSCRTYLWDKPPADHDLGRPRRKG
jgi:NADH pyrophosphatase NudC (nudix superfamily)